MKNIFVLLTMLIVTFNLYAGYYDSGYIEWTQPNGVTFTARVVGDEFCSSFETIDGYQVKMGKDYYYYYAILDDKGEFKCSKNRVGIDPPLKESFHLKRSVERLSQIQAEKEAFNQKLRQSLYYRIESGEILSSEGSTPIHMGIVLVEFSDVKHYPRYKVDHFNYMMFSTNHYWYSDSLGNDIHPEGDRIYGSFREYWE